MLPAYITGGKFAQRLLVVDFHNAAKLEGIQKNGILKQKLS